MAIVTSSSPQNWQFAQDAGVKRDWVQKVYDLDQVKLAESMLDRYDSTSIFYSVGYCRERGAFYTVGPKFLNLGELILPLKAKFSIDGGETFTAVECKALPNWLAFNISILTMDAGELVEELLLLQLTLANGDKKTFEIKNLNKTPKRITMNAHQKDNEVQWIVDWIKYYRTYSVFDFSIYDNGSANISEVIKAIEEEVDDDTRVHITHWPYKFGLPNIHQTKFSQTSSINDFLFQNQSSSWAINCDIDEYIVLGSECDNLPDFLDKSGLNVGCIKFAGSDAPLIAGEDYPDNVSVRNLHWRTKEISSKIKNAFRPKGTQTAFIHHVKLAKELTQRSLTEDDGFYLHALPLNTGWRTPTRRRLRLKFSPGKYVNDDRVAKRMITTD